MQERDYELRDTTIPGFLVKVTPAGRGFLDALTIARESDLVALVQRSCIQSEEVAAQGLGGFDLPVPTPELTIT